MFEYLVHSLLMVSYYRKYKRYKKNLRNCETIQRLKLAEMINKNRNSVYGQSNYFSRVQSAEDFQKKIPLSVYEDYERLIQRIATGEENVLTKEPVLLLKPTSGSSGIKKLIPYTQSLKDEFRYGIAPWLFSLYKDFPVLKKGPSYWSISPKMSDHEERYSENNSVFIGQEEDASYLGRWGKYIRKLIFAVPNETEDITDLNRFRDQTLAHLLSRSELRLLSVWSPTFFLLLIDHLLIRKQIVLELCEALCTVKRFEELTDLFSKEETVKILPLLWRNLEVCSCWTHGQSKVYSEKIQEYFPDITIQSKGLIATEGFISLPFHQNVDPVLSIYSHFYEFQSIDDEAIHFAWRLEMGKRYKIIITTGGGFYRYQLGDVVEVTGFVGNTPTLIFISNSTRIDLFGEKIESHFVAELLYEVFQKLSISPDFYFLSPISSGTTAKYVLYIKSETLEQKNFHTISLLLESKLLENYHYKYCRKLGQLEHSQVFLINKNTNPVGLYKKHMNLKGLKYGDIKCPVIDNHFNWSQIFAGAFIK